MPPRSIAGRYRLEELLGTGGMAEVWLATDLELERPVGLKLLAADADRARFAREARAVAALAHPNINQLYDYGESDGRPYMVLEYLSGKTLEDRLRDGFPLDDATTIQIACDMAAALAHAHERGLVHRDLKPANVLFDEEGRAKIADFGIARLAETGTLTEAGTVLGTAAYISPEQAGGGNASPASDVYSFGVVLFQMLTGHLPFVAESAVALAALHRDAPPPSIAELRPDAPPRLLELTAAALAKDPAARPPDGAALVAALGGPPPAASTTAAAAGAAPTQVLRAQPPPAPRPRRRRWLVPVLAAAALLGLGGAALAFGLTESTGGDASTVPSTVPLTSNGTTRQTTTAPPTTAPGNSATTETTAPTTTTAPATSRTTPSGTRPQTTAPATTAPPTTEPPTTEPPPTDATPTVP